MIWLFGAAINIDTTINLERNSYQLERLWLLFLILQVIYLKTRLIDAGRVIHSHHIAIQYKTSCFGQRPSTKPLSLYHHVPVGWYSMEQRVPCCPPQNLKKIGWKESGNTHKGEMWKNESYFPILFIPGKGGGGGWLSGWDHKKKSGLTFFSFIRKVNLIWTGSHPNTWIHICSGIFVLETSFICCAVL